MHVEIEPLKMVRMDRMNIALGMNRSAVIALLGVGNEVQNQVFYFDNELKIIFDETDRVEFIEFLGGIEGGLQPVIYGVPAFRTDANELYAALERKNNGLIFDRENGYSYGFAEISVGVYREALPKDVEEMIAEAAAHGNPLSEEEIHAAMTRANHFASIGFGVKGYYQ